MVRAGEATLRSQDAGSALGTRDSMEPHPPPHPTFGKTEATDGVSWPVSGIARVNVSPSVQAWGPPPAFSPMLLPGPQSLHPGLERGATGRTEKGHSVRVMAVTTQHHFCRSPERSVLLHPLRQPLRGLTPRSCHLWSGTCMRKPNTTSSPTS